MMNLDSRNSIHDYYNNKRRRSSTEKSSSIPTNSAATCVCKNHTKTTIGSSAKQRNLIDYSSAKAKVDDSRIFEIQNKSINSETVDPSVTPLEQFFASLFSEEISNDSHSSHIQSRSDDTHIFTPAKEEDRVQFVLRRKANAIRMNNSNISSNNTNEYAIPRDSMRSYTNNNESLRNLMFKSKKRMSYAGSDELINSKFSESEGGRTKSIPLRSFSTSAIPRNIAITSDQGKVRNIHNQRSKSNEWRRSAPPCIMECQLSPEKPFPAIPSEIIFEIRGEIQRGSKALLSDCNHPFHSRSFSTSRAA